MNNAPSFPRIGAAAIALGFAVAVVQRFSSGAAWLMAVVIVLGMLMFYPGAQSAFSEFIALALGGK